MDMTFFLTNLLFEAPIDAWLKRFGNNEPNINKEELQKYFDIFQKFSASIANPDPTSYDFQSLKTTALSVEASKTLAFKSSTTKWLTRQIKTLKIASFQTIKEDYIPILKQYEKLKNKLKPIDAYKNIQEIVYDLEDLKQKSGGLSGGSEDELGILLDDGEWIVAMPHTTEASCELGKGTTWCTARTDSQNLFLNYVGRGQGIILFYVIKKNGNPRSNPNDKMSIGFINGEAKFNQGEGNISVNAANQNLTQKNFEHIVGPDKANHFLQIMQEKANKLEGKHPAEEEMKRYASNVEAYKSKLKSFRQHDAAVDFILLIMENNNLSGQVLGEILDSSYRDYFFDDRNEPYKEENLDNFNWQLRSIARETTSPDIIQILLDKLGTFFDHEIYVENLFQNKKAKLTLNQIQEFLGWLKREQPFDKRRQTNLLRTIIAYQSLTTEIIDFILLNFTNTEALCEEMDGTINNSLFSPFALKVFADCEAQNLRAVAAKNPNTPKDVLFDLLGDYEENVVALARANPGLSPEDLTVLLDEAENIKNDNPAGYGMEIKELLANPNIGVGHIEHYYEEFQKENEIDSNFISILLHNPKTPLNIRNDIKIKYGKFINRHQMEFWKQQGLIPENKIPTGESVVSKQSLTSLLF